MGDKPYGTLDERGQIYQPFSGTWSLREEPSSLFDGIGVESLYVWGVTLTEERKTTLVCSVQFYLIYV